MLQNRTAGRATHVRARDAVDPKAGVAANNLAWIYLENGGSLDLALHLAETAKARLAERRRSQRHARLGLLQERRVCPTPSPR